MRIFTGTIPDYATDVKGLLLGGVIGGQFGVSAGQKLKGEQLRAVLALMVLAVALRLLLDLVLKPAELYSIVPLGGA